MKDDYKQRTLTVLGSTGSVGTQALEIAGLLGIRVLSLAAGRNIKLLEEQIRKFHPLVAAVADEHSASLLKAAVADCDVKILSGSDGVCAAAAMGADTVLTSIVGVAGLLPTMAAVTAGSDIALANKETLVAAGELVLKAAAEKNVAVLPVDSEHSAIFQCLQGAPEGKKIKKILLTASGGPFFGRTRDELKNVTVADTMRHPNWVMGAKITVDCATLMNKGLEEIEAVHLFGVSSKEIEVVVHRESIIHSMVEFADSSVIAQLGVADMRLPIQYALTYPARVPSPVKSPDFFEIASLSFFRPDRVTFKCLDVCERAVKKGGLYPAAVNAANEVAVEAFLKNKITFNAIGDTVERALSFDIPDSFSTIDEVIELDAEIRKKIRV